LRPRADGKEECVGRSGLAGGDHGPLGLLLFAFPAQEEADARLGVCRFASLGQLAHRGLVIGADALFNELTRKLATLALDHAVAAIYQYREFAAAGGLVSYGGSNTDLFRQVGLYTGRVLKGEKPADLPVQQSTKVELIINLKTAKALGITVPLSLVYRADEVIE
jgi:putative ABC transport system substrate-binding protein